MGGALDSSRFKTYLSLALDKPANDIQGMVIGGHGDTTMIPLTRLASYNGAPVSQYLDTTSLRKSCCRHYGRWSNTNKTFRVLQLGMHLEPQLPILLIAFLNDQKRMIPCSVLLRGRVWV